MFNQDESGTIYNVSVAGLVVALGGGSIINCYYSGRIDVSVQDNIHSILIGAICADVVSNQVRRAEIKNCHWLGYEGNIAYEAVGRDRATGGVTGGIIDTASYSDISQMYFLADTLNTDMDNPVWVNVPNNTPQLKFVTNGDGA